MKNKLAIFDLDGTLFDTTKVNYLAYRDALINYNCNFSYEYYKTYCNGRYYKDFLPTIIKCNNSILEDIHKIKKDVYSSYLAHAVINTHLFSIIEHISCEYYIAIVTSASKKNCYDILNFFSKTSLFDLIITHEDVKEVKPNPEGFIKAMEFFKINVKDTLIFEDSKSGITAAKASGAGVFIVDTF